MTRVFSSIAGLLIGAGAAVLVASVNDAASWSLQVVAGVAGFGLGAVAMLLLFSDLTVRNPAPASDFHIR